MDHDEKRWRMTTVIFMAIVLAIMGLVSAPDNCFAKFGRTPNIDGKMAPMTGRIDKIGTEYIIIDDTSFKLSNQVSAEGYKEGDRVTFVATYKNEIIKIYPASKKRQPKE